MNNALNQAKAWIRNNTINNNGITVTSKQRIVYPEVTGYFIPTLLTWGEADLALSYAKYLCSIQKEDGSWYDPSNTAPYVFDTAQILKGLIAIREDLPSVDSHIRRGVDWILSNMQPDGRLMTPNKNAWGNNEDFCSELIHVYCLTPIRDAGLIFNRAEYVFAAENILEYYKNHNRDRIMNFSLLSHFYAYVMEGLYDMGEIEMCREAMERLETYRNRQGGIPGLKDVPWICSTGIFQVALVWYKLGEKKKGDSLFEYACGFQNESGGWYGSYPTTSILDSTIVRKVFYRGRRRPYYFPDEEISWAVKYYLDALEYKQKLENDGKRCDE